MEVFKGRPQDTAGREEREVRVYDYLDSLGIEYMRTDHPDNLAYTMEDCRKIDAALETKLCKNLFLCTANKKQFFMLLIPGDKPFKTKYITSQIGTGRLSFADEAKMLEYLDIKPGAVSLMGLMNDHDNNVKLLVDKELLDEEYLGCHPCVNTASMKIKVADAFGPYLKAVHHDMQIVELPWEVE